MYVRPRLLAVMLGAVVISGLLAAVRPLYLLPPSTQQAAQKLLRR